MLKKRLIGVITVRNGWAVQSIGYNRYLPLGRPEIIAENLDRWGVDEILVLCIDRMRKQLGPALDTLEKIARMGIGTPLIYGGGITNSKQAVEIIQGGADRVAIDRLLHSAPEEVMKISERLGSQAVIASMPMMCGTASSLAWNYLANEEQSLSDSLRRLFSDGYISESLLIDTANEGRPDSFDMRILESVPWSTETPLITFGGISTCSQVKHLLQHPRVAAVAVGNFLNYREHAVQHIKAMLRDMPLRPQSYHPGNLTIDLQYD